jgi:hypothetical protein
MPRGHQGIAAVVPLAAQNRDHHRPVVSQTLREHLLQDEVREWPRICSAVRIFMEVDR